MRNTIFLNDDFVEYRNFLYVRNKYKIDVYKIPYQNLVGRVKLKENTKFVIDLLYRFESKSPCEYRNLLIKASSLYKFLQ